MATRTTNPNPRPDFWRDVRVLQIVGQLIFAIAVIVLIYGIATSILSTLNAKNITPSFTFLSSTGGFDLGEAPAWYSSNSTYWEAFQVGIYNTMRIIVIGLVAATLLGVLVGIFLLTNNWLIRTIFRTIVEVLRNTPLLVQLFMWYFIIVFSLPRLEDSLTIPNESLTIIPFRLIGYIVLAVMVWRSVRLLSENAPRRVAMVYGTAALIFIVEAGFWLMRTQANWQNAADGSVTVQFGLYFLVSIALIAAAWFAPPPLRWVALGSTIGQLIGGLIFHFGLIPGGVFRVEIYPAVYISIRGFVFPELLPTARFAEWMAFVGLGFLLALVQWVYLGRMTETTGQHFPRTTYALGAIVLCAVIGWTVVGIEPGLAVVPVQQDDQTVEMPIDEAREQDLLTKEDEALYSQAPLLFLLPERTKFRFTTGMQVTPEYMSLFLGLTIYTAGFIAEIVRAGIQAVPKGQIEAARALGLSQGDLLRRVILPQALRVIIPPLGNQYLNLAKNSSLATVVAYADIYLTSVTMSGTSGQSVPIIIMVMVTYLIISLTISAGMNWVNRRFQIVTR